MLLRFFVDNVLSFDSETEFNTLPAPKIKRLAHHTYSLEELCSLKVASLYGANGSGKSNLIFALHHLISIVTDKHDITTTSLNKFKLNDKNQNKSQLLGVEFSYKNNAYVYGIEINKNKILSEELFISGKGNNDDKLVYRRHTNFLDKIEVTFDESFRQEEGSDVLKSIIEKNLSKPHKTILKVLNELDIQIPSVKDAYLWFEQGIEVLLPDSKPVAFTKQMIENKNFNSFANQLVKSFNTGIDSLEIQRLSAKEYFGENEDNEINNAIEKVKNEPDQRLTITEPEDEEDEELVLENIDGIVYVTRLISKHRNNKNNNVDFYLFEESEGTQRLIDYIPFFKGIIDYDKTYIIDEIERSIHPLIVKELVTKFSNAKKTKGQLIFTTHESNLLDQSILRPDEIWFAEKSPKGGTELYPLSDFKEHHTKDIRKGYLNGRYGAIPFLGNLKDLNWV